MRNKEAFLQMQTIALNYVNRNERVYNVYNCNTVSKIFYDLFTLYFN